LSAALYMLGTDTCIFLMRGESPALARKVQSVEMEQQVMSVVTLAELTCGVMASARAKRKHNQLVLDSLALHLAVLDWPQDAAQHYAEIRLDLKKRGAQLGAADLMIAAHAHSLGAVVVTNNTKDFGRVKGLQVENWTRP
jgi:tRNA(fMet)-specific endonuclease VapC